MPGLLTIEDSTLLMMASDPRYLAILPCLSAPAEKVTVAKRPGCGRCGRTAAKDSADALQEMRNCVGSVHRDKVVSQQLKELLGADRIRVRRRLSKGSDTLTF